MTVGRFLAGLVALTAIVGPMIVGARAVRQRLLPDWTGALAALAVITAVLCALAAVGQVIGTLGLFSVGPMIGACVVVGLGGAGLATRGRPARDGAPRRRVVATPDRIELWVAALACALVAAVWATWVDQAHQFGIGNGDSVWYHLPIAARFVQDGSITPLHFLNGEALVTYYPANTSLLHAFGFLAFGRDDLSLVLNFAFLPFALLGGWCIGRRWRLGPTAMTGVAVALALPIVAASQAGSAKDDIVSIAFLLATVALLLNSEGRRPAMALSGAAAGFALSTKLTMLLPVVILAVGIVVVFRARGTRASAVAWWVGAVATGSFWYLRNLVATGNPVPSLGLVGLPSPPTPSIDRYGPALVEFIGDRSAWDRIFLPGLDAGLGTVWMVVLGLALFGAVSSLTKKGDHTEQLIGVVSLAVAGAFVFLPGTAFAVGVLDQRRATGAALLIFVYNLRYVVPAIALGLAILPRSRLLMRGGRHQWALLAYAAVLLVTESTQSGLRFWAPGHETAAVAAMLATVLLFWLLGLRRVPTDAPGRPDRRRRNQRRLRAAAAVTLVMVVGAYAASRTYHDNRYGTNPLAEWVRRISDRRIAIAGFAGQYPLVGDDLSNRVQYVGRRGADGSFTSYRRCLAWRRALRRGKYDFVVTPTNVVTPSLGYDLARWKLGAPTGEPPSEPRESAWNRSDPGLDRVFQQAGVTVYRVGKRVSGDGC